MATQASTVAAINAASAEAQAIGVTPPSGSGVLATLAKGYARNFGSYADPDPGWYPKSINITDDGGVAFDPKREQFLDFGGSHGRMQGNVLRAFNTRTGLWTNLVDSTPWAAMLSTNLDSFIGKWISDGNPVTRHTYSHMVVVVDKLYIMQSFCNPDNLPVTPQSPGGDLPDFHAKFCIFDLVTGSWTYSAHSMPWTHASASVFDPVSGNIYAVGLTVNAGPGLLWKYDPRTDALATGPAMDASALRYTQPVDFVYCPLDDRFYSFENNGVVRRISIDRANLASSTFTLPTTTGPKPLRSVIEGSPTGRPRGYPSFTWDGQRIGGCVIDGIHFSLDPATLTWFADPVLVEAGSTGGSPPSHDFSCSAFMNDASQCYIFIQNAVVGGPRTWAYRPPYLP